MRPELLAPPRARKARRRGLPVSSAEIFAFNTTLVRLTGVLRRGEGGGVGFGTVHFSRGNPECRASDHSGTPDFLADVRRVD